MQSAFQFIPEVFSGVKVRSLCRTLEFIYLYLDYMKYKPLSFGEEKFCALKCGNCMGIVWVIILQATFLYLFLHFTESIILNLCLVDTWHSKFKSLNNTAPCFLAMYAQQL